MIGSGSHSWLPRPFGLWLSAQELGASPVNVIVTATSLRFSHVLRFHLEPLIHSYFQVFSIIWIELWKVPQHTEAYAVYD